MPGSRPIFFEGVSAAAVTPRRAETPNVDLAATFEVVDFLSASGVRALVLLGSTGEFLHFDIEERMRLVQLVAKRSRIPVLAAVSHSTLDGALLLGRDAAASGAAALLVMPPYFFRYEQEDLCEFFLAFAQEMKDAVPILLYNVPRFTTPIEPETAAGLLATGLFAGIKDSSGDWNAFLALKAARDHKPFLLMAGNDEIFVRARLNGADGVISGIASALPELMLALDAAIASGETKKRERLEAALGEFIEWVQRFPYPVVVREASALRGLNAGPLNVPLSRRRRQELDEFREWFNGWFAGLQESLRA